LPERLGNGIAGDGIHQSNLQRPRGGDFFRSDKKLQRPSLPDQARQALRPSPSRHQSESGASMSEHGVRGRDPAVTGDCKIKSSAHAVALDRSDDRSRITGDCVHERLSQGGKFVGFGAAQSGDFVQIGADREEQPISRDNQWAEFGSAVLPLLSQFDDGECQGTHAGAAQAVSTVRRSKPQDANRTVAINVKESGQHGNILREARVGTDALGSLP